MAATNAVKSVYLCHFCSNEFADSSTLFNHLTRCNKNSHLALNHRPVLSVSIPPKLNAFEINCLHLVKLRHINEPKSRKTTHSSPFVCGELDQYLQIPLSNLFSQGYLSKLSTNPTLPLFDDVWPLDDPIDEEDSSSVTLNHPTKLSSCHVYKYSRREREQFNNRLQRTMPRKHYPVNKVHRPREAPSFLFHGKHFIIDIPTKISSRLRLSSSTNRIFPLLFDNYFNELVKLPTSSIFNNYLNDMTRFFHLIHSIASQEFQYLVFNHDQQHQLSFTNYSLMNVLRQTFLESTTNHKRSFFQTFPDHHDHHSQHEHDSAMHSEPGSFIPPLKIRRYDHSSYEIQNRSTSSCTSSSSSGMSITQIHHGSIQTSSDDRCQSETRSKKHSAKLCDQPINSNPSLSTDLEKKDFSQCPVESTTLNNDSTSINHYFLSNDGNSRETNLSSSINQMNELSKVSKTNGPNVIIDLANDNVPKYQSMVLNDGARIRIVNCSNDNSKSTSVRNHNGSVNKRLSHPIDENWTSKNGRMPTRKTSSTNSKTGNIADIGSNYQTQSVLLTDSEISHGWTTHSVFYRCHACSHEEFFVVLSRECMNLHISSKHGNMEENFKQRISNFLNNQGRALKIFQHYLKWQHPWSEKEIDQIFQLSNIHSRTNGTL